MRRRHTDKHVPCMLYCLYFFNESDINMIKFMLSISIIICKAFDSISHENMRNTVTRWSEDSKRVE